MRAVLLSLIASVTGCGGSNNPDASIDAPEGPADAAVDRPPIFDAAPGDAGPPDFSCMGVTPPTTAPDPVRFQGDVFEALSDAPAPDVRMDVLQRSNDALITFGMTDTDGIFDFDVTSGGSALDIYAKLSNVAYVDTFVYPPEPVFQDFTGLSVPVFSSTDVLLLYGFALGTSHEAGRGTVGILVTDCKGHPLQGATVSISPATPPTDPAQLVIAYTDPSSGQPSPDMTSTDVDGLAVIGNAVADVVTINGDHMGTALKSNTILVRDPGFTLTVLHP